MNIDSIKIPNNKVNQIILYSKPILSLVCELCSVIPG